METPLSGNEEVAALPGSELWGKEVRDVTGRRMGTIDSIARSSSGPVKAIVLTARKPRQFVFVDLDGAILDGEVVVAALVTPVLLR